MTRARARDAVARPLSFGDLFDPALLAAAQGLSIRLTQAQKGGRLADQKTAARGQGSDFADFKPYVPGDDLRSMDWNLYRRLGKTFVRVFEERQDMPAYFLVDRSRSLYVEAPPRIHAAQRITLALAAMALGQHDSIGLFPFSDDLSIQFKALSGKANVAQAARALADYEALGGTALAAAVDQVSAMRLRQGLLVVVSDFFSQEGLDATLAALGRAPHRLLLVQLVRDHDADPGRLSDLQGDLIIDDGEGGVVQIAATDEVVARYRDAYRRFDEALTHFALTRGAGLLRVDAGAPIIDQLPRLFSTGALHL